MASRGCSLPKERGKVSVQLRWGQGDSRSNSKKRKPPAAETVLCWIPAFTRMTEGTACGGSCFTLDSRHYTCGEIAPGMTYPISCDRSGLRDLLSESGPALYCLGLRDRGMRSIPYIGSAFFCVGFCWFFSL